MFSDDENELDDEEVTIDPNKLARIEKEKKELLASLAGGNFTTQKTKVAAILNLYPESRNSDITLALKYWETFQPEIHNTLGILPKDLFRLERLHYIVRARAKIQNEYGLFPADAKVRNHRKKREEVMYDAVPEDVAPRKVIKRRPIFSSVITGSGGSWRSTASLSVRCGVAPIIT